MPRRQSQGKKQNNGSQQQQQQRPPVKQGQQDYSAVPPPAQLLPGFSSLLPNNPSGRQRGDGQRPAKTGRERINSNNMNNGSNSNNSSRPSSASGMQNNSQRRQQSQRNVINSISASTTPAEILAHYPWIEQLGLGKELDSILAGPPPVPQPAANKLHPRATALPPAAASSKPTPIGNKKNASKAADTAQPSSSRSTGNAKDRRLFYDEYWPAEEVDRQVKTGKLLQGELRINKRRRHFAYVTVEGIEHDLVVIGSRDQNRALNGDRVAVRVLGKRYAHEYENARSGRDLFKDFPNDAEQQVSDAKVASEMNALKLEEEELAEERVALTETVVSPLESPAKDIEEDDGEEPDGDEENMPHTIALVVRIIDKRPGQTFSGFLMPDGWRPGMSVDDADKLMGYLVGGDDGVNNNNNNANNNGKRQYQHIYPPLTIVEDDDDDDEEGGDEWTDEDDDGESEPSGNNNNTVQRSIGADVTAAVAFNGGNASAKPDSHRKNRKKEKAGSKQQQPSKNLYFKPCDNRAPFILIGRSSFPADFKDNFAEKYRDKLYLASIERWPATTMHPYGILGKVMGDMGDVLAETEAILESNSIRHSDFTRGVLQCLPALPWSVGEEDERQRLDLRSKRIFTIDPETARDLDDAVSCELLPDGNLSVGVHIADVSHFVRPGTALDREARTRATTTYLVQKAVPMLPSMLCENLCSLNPGVDRLAFSVIWRMTPDARVLDTWFGRTIIRSCVKMSYENAQRLIDGQPWQEAVGRSLAEGCRQHTEAEVISDVRRFHQLSLVMRRRRFESGALTINQPKLTFRLDDTGHPSSCSVYEIKDSNRLIEEFMLLANMSVAKKISDHFPEGALLRCHPPPKSKIMQEFLDYCQRMGQKMSAESAATLQQSILRIGNEETRAIFQLLAVKPMQRARYFSTGDHKDDRQRWRHFALNVDLYTHFTSPIRRYADVIVHRLLQMALDEDAGEIIAPAGQQREQQKALAEISLTARQCNLKKEDARAAQDASSKLFLCVYLRRLEQSTNRPIICDAVVMDFGGERGMDVYVPQFALDRRVFLDDCGVAKVSMSSARDRVTLHWLSGGARRPLPPYPKPNRSDNKPPAAVQDSQTGDLVTVINGGDTGGVVQSIRLLDHVFVRLSVEGRSPMDVKVYLVHPDHSSVGQAKRHQFAVNSAANIAAAQRGSSSVLEETFVDVD